MRAKLVLQDGSIVYADIPAAKGAIKADGNKMLVAFSPADALVLKQEIGQEGGGVPGEKTGMQSNERLAKTKI